MISVIIPVYNAEKYIDRCLSSVLSQDYENYEIIAVNDGSTDGSLKRLQSYGDKIKLFDKPNGGVSSARNLGIKMCSGDFITFLDADDCFGNDGYLTGLAENANEANVLPCAANDKLKADGRYLDTDIKTEYLKSRYCEFLDYDICAVWGKLYKKSVIERYALLFDENIKFGEDGIFNLQYFSHIENMRFVQSASYCYMREIGSCTNSVRKQLFDEYKVIYSYLSEFLGDEYGEEATRYLQRVSCDCAVTFYNYYRCKDISEAEFSALITEISEFNECKKPLADMGFVKNLFLRKLLRNKKLFVRAMLYFNYHGSI